MKIYSPFVEGKYAGKIHISICKDKDSAATHVRVVGARIALECFQGQYATDLKRTFGKKSVLRRREEADLMGIFGNAMVKKNYGSQKKDDIASIRSKIEKDASRPYHGNLFTGYAVVEKKSARIIGRVSIGSGYEAGESQSGLIIRKSRQGKGFGKEACCLVGALALFLTEHRYEVGDPGSTAAVKRFSATTLDTNDQMIKFITGLGMKKIRPLTKKENYSDSPRSLYGIEANQLSSLVGSFLDKDKITYSIK